MSDIQQRPRKSGAGIVVNIIGIVLCVIFIPVIVVNLVLIVKTYTAPDEMPSVFGVSPVICLSGSMSPEFEAGDMIFIEKTDTKTLQRNDVICYISSGGETAVTHRIIDIHEEDGQRTFVTAGDANNAEDASVVYEDEIQGKYMGIHIPGLGNVAMFMQTTVGMIVFIVCPLLLFVLWDIVRRAIASRKTGNKAAELQAELDRLKAQVGEVSGDRADEEVHRHEDV